MTSPVVFLGPSLPLAEARRLLPHARFERPIRRGSLDTLALDPPAAIGIVDGEFHQSLAISPKEILPLLRRGIPVFGAASMGALRAVELASRGMTGVGRIYRDYASGRCIDDDEVAMTFCPETLRPLSEPMRNLRYALAAARRSGVLDGRSAACLVRAMKRLYFPERTSGRLFAETARLFGAAAADQIRNWWPSAPNLKADDARALLRAIAHSSIRTS